MRLALGIIVGIIGLIGFAAALLGACYMEAAKHAADRERWK